MDTNLRTDLDVDRFWIRTDSWMWTDISDTHRLSDVDRHFVYVPGLLDVDRHLA